MPRLTLRVLDGADRGRTFLNLEPPVTIGREEGNTIQLNDERVSRYHAKIQTDHENVVLTDLESTNGTKVNGEDVQLRNLRFGDVVQVGRTVMVFGTREQISQRLKDICSGGRGKKSRRKTSPLPRKSPPRNPACPGRTRKASKRCSSNCSRRTCRNGSAPVKPPSCRKSLSIWRLPSGN